MPSNMSCGWDLQGCCGWAYLAPCWSSSRSEPPRDVWGSGTSLATPPCCQCSALTFTFRGRRSWRCLQCADALGGAVSSHQHRGFPDWNTTLHCWKTRRLTLPSSGCQGPRYQSVILQLVFLVVHIWLSCLLSWMGMYAHFCAKPTMLFGTWLDPQNQELLQLLFGDGVLIGFLTMLSGRPWAPCFFDPPPCFFDPPPCLVDPPPCFVYLRFTFL